jgi:hypothetical protein
MFQYSAIDNVVILYSLKTFLFVCVSLPGHSQQNVPEHYKLTG